MTAKAWLAENQGATFLDSTRIERQCSGCSETYSLSQLEPIETLAQVDDRQVEPTIILLCGSCLGDCEYLVREET